MQITVLAGGYGGAKMAHGLAMALQSRPQATLSVVVNVADDFELHGLHVAPDLDTVMYTLAGLANTETGWGIRNETWSAREMLARYGAETWFSVGDHDLATHVRRTHRLRQGASLSDVTRELASALGVTTAIVPATDDAVRTQVETAEGWLEFQDYFVRRQHRDEVRALRLVGIETATASEAALDAIRKASAIIVAPSNPYLSVAPTLALSAVLDRLLEIEAPVVAVSPIVGGQALRGPADRILEALGGEASALGVARHYVETYPGLLDVLVIDSVDAHAAPSIESLGLAVLVTQTVMRTDDDRRRLADDVLTFAERIAESPDAV